MAISGQITALNANVGSATVGNQTKADRQALLMHTGAW